MNCNSDLSFSVLIPDGDHALLFQAVYCLSKNKNISIHVLSNKKHVPMRYSRHVKSFKFFKENTVEEWLQEIDDQVIKHQIDVILPLQEKSIENLIRHKGELKSNEILTLSPSLKNFKIAVNKANLSAHLTSIDIDCPKTQIVEPDSNYHNTELLSYPIIAKPAESLSGYGIKLLSNKDEAHHFFKSLSSTYVLQEFIEGYDIDCSVLCKDGNVLLHAIQRGILFENRVFAPAIGIKFLHEEAVLKTVKTLMASLEWTGIAHVDLRYDIKSKIFKVIEVNGRFWGSMDGALSVGYNFPYLYCLLSKHIPFEVDTYKPIKFYNFKGLIRLIKQKPFVLFNWSFLKKNTNIFFILKDPLAILVKYIMRTKVLLRNR